MKKWSMNRALSMLMAIVVAFGMLCINTVEAKAASEWNIDVPEVLWMGGSYSEGLYVAVWKENKHAVVTSVKVSDTSVVKVNKDKWKNEKGKYQNYFLLEPKSPGKTKVTVSYKLPSGKKKKGTTTVTVKKYPNQIKSLKINGKKVNVSKNKLRYDKGNISKTKIKINLKLKKGWKITDVWGSCWDMDSQKVSDVKNAKSKLKKGTAISFPKKYSDFELLIDMSNGKDSISYHIRLSRSENP